MAEVLHDHRLADAGAALQQHVLAALDEVELKQAVDERTGQRDAGEVDGITSALLEIGELLESLGRARGGSCACESGWSLPSLSTASQSSSGPDSRDEQRTSVFDYDKEAKERVKIRKREKQLREARLAAEAEAAATTTTTTEAPAP